MALTTVGTLVGAALARAQRFDEQFGLADTLHGSGFLSVYIVGLALGTAAIPAKRTNA